MNRILLLLFLLIPLSAAPDDFDEAVAAYANADYEKAYQLWRPLAESGDGGAMFDLGVLYWDGKGTPRNRSLALNWWHKAAEQNVAAAQYNLGLAYYLGTEVSRDVKEAISFMRLAADQGHDLGISALPLLEQDFLSTSSANEDESLRAYSGADIGETLTKLYSSPSFQSKVLTTLEVGSPILVLNSEAEWSSVSVPNNIRFWVYGNYIASEGDIHKVTGTGVRVRTQPTTNKSSIIFGTLPTETVVEIIGVKNDWKEIRKPFSISVWIPNSHVRFISETDEEWEEKWEEMSAGAIAQSSTETATEIATQTPEALPKPIVASKTPTGNDSTKGVSAKPISPEEVPHSRPAVVSSSFAEITGSPTETGQLLKLLAKGASVQILEEKDRWARVVVPTGLYVWVYGEYLSADENRWFINTDHVRARSRPSTSPDSAVLGTFSKGSDVQFISRQGDWKRVKAVESVSGWIQLEQLAPSDIKRGN